MRYEKSRGAFLKYAAMAIRSRLIDYQRREKKHSGLISLDMPSGEEDDRSLAETLDSGKDEIGEMETRSAAKTEIMEFAAELGRYGLSLSEIAENCPRQQRTLAACHRALHSARENPDLLEQLVRTKKLPLMALAAHCGVERKTLERHRKYLVAILLAYTNGFEIIRGHLHKVVPQKKEATVQ